MATFTISLIRKKLFFNLQHVRNISATRNTYQVSKLGFIGLGNMGQHMAQNLMKNGYRVTVYDVFPESMTKIAGAGAQLARHPAEVAENSDCIITMLPSSPHVIEVYTGENGILQGLNKGTMLIDSSTIDPAVSKSINKQVTKKGAKYLDAPVSGGVNGAKSATLTFMVGGDENDFENAKKLLECMGKSFIYCGVVGSGQAAKICNNMLLAIGMIGTAETMNLGIRLGLDPKLLAKILNSSSGRCWSSDTYNPVPNVMENVPSSNNYQGGFGTAMMTKDLGLAQNSATATMTPTPLGSLALQLYRLMMQQGYSNKDFSSVYLFLKENPNI